MGEVFGLSVTGDGVESSMLPEKLYGFLPCSLSSAVLDVLGRYDWPGNIRELDNAIERAVILAEGQPHIEVCDLPPEIRDNVAMARQRSEDQLVTLAEIERRHILETLERLGGNRKAAADALGIGVNTLWRRLKTYGLVHQRGRAADD